MAAPISCPNCWRAGVAPTRIAGLQILRDVSRLRCRHRDDGADGEHRRPARPVSVQPAAANTEAMPSRVTSVMPEVGCDDTPTMPTMRAATVTNSMPKIPEPAAQMARGRVTHAAAEHAGHERRDASTTRQDAADDEAAGQVAVGASDRRRPGAVGSRPRRV